MAEILITGATGLLGTRLAPLLARSHEVTAVSRRATNRPVEGVRWIISDLSDESFLQKLPDRVDVVIHLAQAATFRDFPEKAIDTFRVNVASTALLLDWAQRCGAGQYIFASTGSVYANPSSDPHTEDEPLTPLSLSFYAASKLAGEALSLSYSQHFSVVAVRPFVMYGPGQNAEMLIPRLVASIRAGRPINLAGTEGMRTNPIYVDDAARAVAAALGLKGTHVVNLAGPEVLSLRRIADCIGKSLGVEPHYSVRETASSGDLIGDVRKMTALLGAPTTPFSAVAEPLCSPVAQGPSGRAQRDDER